MDKMQQLHPGWLRRIFLLELQPALCKLAAAMGFA
jgi:hypothetical protein